MKNKPTGKAFVIMLCAVIIFCISSCKKDYPDDIPGWIKEKIKDCKKHGCCAMGACLQIQEWERNGTIIYSYYYYSDVEIVFYDNSGTQLCAVALYDNNFDPNYESIGTVIQHYTGYGQAPCDIEGYIYKRKIWKAKK